MSVISYFNSILFNYRQDNTDVTFLHLFFEYTKCIKWKVK